VQFISSNDTLHLLFDTGANASELYKKYFEKHKNDIENNGIPESETYAVMGETTEKQVYRLKDFKFCVGKKQAVLPDIRVYNTDLRIDHHMFSGCIGQDFISLFNEMIINYEYMYVDFN